MASFINLDFNVCIETSVKPIFLLKKIISEKVIRRFICPCVSVVAKKKFLQFNHNITNVGIVLYRITLPICGSRGPLWPTLLLYIIIIIRQKWVRFCSPETRALVTYERMVEICNNDKIYRTPHLPTWGTVAVPSPDFPGEIARLKRTPLFRAIMKRVVSSSTPLGQHCRAAHGHNNDQRYPVNTKFFLED